MIILAAYHRLIICNEDEERAHCAQDERKSCKTNEKPLDSITEIQGVTFIWIVPTGLEPVSPA